MKKNDIIKTHIVDMTNDGEGVGKTDAFTWFIKDAVIGDTIEATVMKLKKNYGYARLTKVLESSKDRCEALCPAARACGGCNLQNMSYEAQLAFKENKVRNNLIRIGGFDEAFVDRIMRPIIGMDDPWRYRNKAIVPFGTDKNGNVVAGFYAAHSHNIISCTDCLLGAEENREIIEAVKRQYDPAIRHVLIRKGFKTGQIMVCIVANRKIKLRFDLPFVTTTVLNINDKDTNVILGEKTYILDGPGYIEDYIGKIKFKISAKSFFQVNPVQVEKLYAKAVEYADLNKNETAWDLYCGIGTITLSLAERAKAVYGVEYVPEAVEDARNNAADNCISNVEFFVGKAEDVIQRDDFVKPDVVVVDPPRKGCDELCLDTIIRMQPKRVVYVSCDSATLARDLKILSDGGYEIKELTPVDQFPQTVHVETVVLLSRKEK